MLIELWVTESCQILHNRVVHCGFIIGISMLVIACYFLSRSHCRSQPLDEMWLVKGRASTTGGCRWSSLAVLRLLQLGTLSWPTTSPRVVDVVLLLKQILLKLLLGGLLLCEHLLVLRRWKAF